MVWFCSESEVTLSNMTKSLLKLVTCFIGNVLCNTNFTNGDYNITLFDDQNVTVSYHDYFNFVWGAPNITASIWHIENDLSETRGLLLKLIWVRHLNQSLQWYDWDAKLTVDTNMTETSWSKRVQIWVFPNDTYHMTETPIKFLFLHFTHLRLRQDKKIT